MLTVTTIGTGWHAGRRLFGMQIRRAALRHIFFDPLLERRSAWQSARHNVASARLGFHDRHIRFAGDREKIICCAAAYEAGCPIMIRQCDLMKCFTVEL